MRENGINFDEEVKEEDWDKTKEESKENKGKKDILGIKKGALEEKNSVKKGSSKGRYKAEKKANKDDILGVKKGTLEGKNSVKKGASKGSYKAKKKANKEDNLSVKKCAFEGKNSIRNGALGGYKANDKMSKDSGVGSGANKLKKKVLSG